MSETSNEGGGSGSWGLRWAIGILTAGGVATILVSWSSGGEPALWSLGILWVVTVGALMAVDLYGRRSGQGGVFAPGAWSYAWQSSGWGLLVLIPTLALVIGGPAGWIPIEAVLVVFPITGLLGGFAWPHTVKIKLETMPVPGEEEHAVFDQPVMGWAAKESVMGAATGALIVVGLFLVLAQDPAVRVAAAAGGLAAGSLLGSGVGARRAFGVELASPGAGDGPTR